MMTSWGLLKPVRVKNLTLVTNQANKTSQTTKSRYSKMTRFDLQNSHSYDDCQHKVDKFYQVNNVQTVNLRFNNQLQWK